MSLNLHPYDGVTRVFSSNHPSDQDKKIIEIILKSAILPQWQLGKYRLSFYSGGMGIVDHMAIQIQISPDDFQNFIGQKGYQDIERLYVDQKAEELIWLFGIEDPDWPGFLDSAKSFIGENNAYHFNLETKIFCDVESGVNDYTFLFYLEGFMHLIGFSQG